MTKEMSYKAVPPPAPLTGSEVFTGTDKMVLDFWKFAMGDLRMNNVRGCLAEFLVATALGAAGNRVEWDAYDVLTPAGVRVEVKARGHLQSWPQRRPNIGPFSIPATSGWDPKTGKSTKRDWNADVYVLCVQAAMDHDQYDPLDTGQRDFYVLRRSQVVEHAGRALSLTKVKELAVAACRFDELAAAVATASKA